MARVRMVTRTVDVTVAEVMCLNVVTAEVTIQNLKVSGIFQDNIALMKQIKKEYETDDFKPVNIQSTQVEEILYGMTEAQFIALANILPPRGTKETDDTVEVEE